MSCVLKLPRQLSVLIAVGLILTAGLPQICCAIVSTAGQPTAVCAMCHAGECGDCPCCRKNKSCPAPASPTGDSSRHQPVSNLCQLTPLPTVSKATVHMAPLDALLPSFHAAHLVLSENFRCVVELPAAVDPPTLVHLSCLLLT